MTIEIVTTICALIGAVVAGFGAATVESPARKRTLGLITALCSIVGIVAGFEAKYRGDQLTQARALLERRWPIIEAAKVVALEVEVLLADGFTKASDINSFLQDAVFTIDGVNITDASGEPETRIALSDVFSPANIPNAARLGVTRATVVTNRFGSEKTIQAFRKIGCIASGFIKQQALRSPGGTDPTICAITFDYPVTNPGLTLDDVLAAEIIRLVLRPENGVCMGPCEQVFISVRAVLGTGDGLFEDMVELSPRAYVEAPHRADDGRLVYQLSGATLARIVALDFKRSFGFRNQQAFALTRGFIFGLYQSLTTRESEMQYSGLVWSTDAKPDKADLLEGVPEEDRSEVEIFAAPEWCGFGAESACWYRFALFSPVAAPREQVEHPGVFSKTQPVGKK